MDRNRQGQDDFPLEPLQIVGPICLQGKPVPDRQWLWPGWIPMHATTALYGDGGLGKSLLAQQLMTSCATGQLFLGQDVMRCRVLGIFCEDDEDELHRRQAAINRSLGIEFGDLEDMQWVSRVASDNVFMTFGPDGRGQVTPLYEQVLSAAKESGAQLILVDTAADTFAGNENDRPSVRRFISGLNRLALEINGAVVLLAHPSVSGKTSGDGSGGSTAWSNSVRSRLYLHRGDLDKDHNLADPDTRFLARRKSNYSKAGEELSLKFDDGCFQFEGITRPVEDGWSLERQNEAETGFLAGLSELAEKGMNCNIHKGQANFAPKAIHEKTTAAEAYSVDELHDAMNRLIKANRIESVVEGPPSRQRSFLRVVAPNLPGV